MLFANDYTFSNLSSLLIESQDDILILQFRSTSFFNSRLFNCFLATSFLHANFRQCDIFFLLFKNQKFLFFLIIKHFLDELKPIILKVLFHLWDVLKVFGDSKFRILSLRLRYHLGGMLFSLK